MNNSEFLEVIKKSFITCLKTSERSNEKLKILHGAIASDIHKKINNFENKYELSSLGFDAGKESKIAGRYLNKAVDIVIKDKLENKVVAGIAVKFVMSNYSQNSNNYFENMLGETANIRSNLIPYFQIFIIPNVIPYYEKSGKLAHWEHISEHYLSKYIKLSNDNIENFMHTPNKTLFFAVDIDKRPFEILKTKEDYKQYYTNNDFSIVLSNLEFNFGSTIIYNDYEKFINKVIYSVLGM